MNKQYVVLSPLLRVLINHAGRLDMANTTSGKRTSCWIHIFSNGQQVRRECNNKARNLQYRCYNNTFQNIQENKWIWHYRNNKWIRQSFMVHFRTPQEENMDLRVKSPYFTINNRGFWYKVLPNREVIVCSKLCQIGPKMRQILDVLWSVLKKSQICPLGANLSQFRANTDIRTSEWIQLYSMQQMPCTHWSPGM